MSDNKFAKDGNGEIMRNYKGWPMLADFFVNEPSDDYWDYFDAQEVLDLFVNEGVELPEHILRSYGFVRIKGKWILPGDENNPKSRRCPACKSGKRVRIRYGLPGPERPRENDKRPEWMKVVILGGCCIDPSCPKWHCTQCGYEWGKIGSRY